MHYYRFDIGDYRRDTTHLTPIEHYIHRSLIDWYYLDEKPIPKETQTVMRRLSLGNEFAQNISNVLNDFYILEVDGWHHKRIDAELLTYQSNSGKNRENGKLGGRPKKTHPVINGFESESENNPNQKPITNNDKPLTNIKNILSYSDDFEMAWSLYPNRPGASKKTSFKAWEAQIKKGVEPRVIISGVKGYSNYCRERNIEPQYIKQPSTFFGPGEHYLSDWSVTAQNSRPGKFDPVAFVNGAN